MTTGTERKKKEAKNLSKNMKTKTTNKAVI